MEINRKTVVLKFDLSDENIRITLGGGSRNWAPMSLYMGNRKIEENCAIVYHPKHYFDECEENGREIKILAKRWFKTEFKFNKKIINTVRMSMAALDIFIGSKI